MGKRRSEANNETPSTNVIVAYTLNSDTRRITLNVPRGAECVDVQLHPNDSKILLWYLSQSDAPLEQRVIITSVTNQTVPANAIYLGTAQLHNGYMTTHCFELE